MKSFAKMAMIAATAMSMNLATPSKSEAFILFTGGDVIEHADGPQVVWCILFIPVCLLDEKTPVSAVTAQELLDNGYSAQQVQNIALGQEMFNQAVKNGTVKIDAALLSNSKALANTLRASLPLIPQDYVQFVEQN